MDDNFFAFKNLKERMKSDKKLVFVIILSILAIAFLVIPEFINKDDSKEPQTQNGKMSELSYLEDTEKKLKDIVSSIEGTGNTKVMITLENTAEQVYAQNEKTKQDNSEISQNPKNSMSNEREYVLIESNSRGEEGLIIKLIQPKIRGVAIVCEGGGNDKIKGEIIETVTALLDISAARVYVTKMG